MTLDRPSFALSLFLDIQCCNMNIYSILGGLTMWERIAASGILIIGAIVLFAVFTAALFILERKEIKRYKRKAQPVRLVHIENTKRAA